MARASWEPGRAIVVQYQGDALLHERYLLMKTSSSVYAEFMGSNAPKKELTW